MKYYYIKKGHWSSNHLPYALVHFFLTRALTRDPCVDLGYGTARIIFYIRIVDKTMSLHLFRSNGYLLDKSNNTNFTGSIKTDQKILNAYSCHFGIIYLI